MWFSIWREHGICVYGLGGRNWFVGLYRLILGWLLRWLTVLNGLLFHSRRRVNVMVCEGTEGCRDFFYQSRIHGHFWILQGRTYRPSQGIIPYHSTVTIMELFVWHLILNSICDQNISTYVTILFDNALMKTKSILNMSQLLLILSIYSQNHSPSYHFHDSKVCWACVESEEEWYRVFKSFRFIFKCFDIEEECWDVLRCHCHVTVYSQHLA